MTTTTKQPPPIELVTHVARSLGALTEEVVFVGGAITGMLLTDEAAPAVSATKDVDVIVSVTTRSEYLGGLSSRMRSLGFHEDSSEDAPMCRWRLGDSRGVKLDLMPTDPMILGFSNRWFPGAFESAVPRTLPSGQTIRVVTAPYFLATKLEAFAGRGAGDYIGSKDMEDFVAVVHGRPTPKARRAPWLAPPRSAILRPPCPPPKTPARSPGQRSPAAAPLRSSATPTPARPR
ncbi:hypothetical protein G6O69_04850 [Pseudenhygromyxa sp. WMMC2535]|uniref:hypothetical protein n=1 Tax=Pseudenhygromyxa sp. WMMC2535 TaxID=2712867 RepID=UPI001553B149|nr:hypothetical protein [Pseudenhygromyxa sp. WMMC2535]